MPKLVCYETTAIQYVLMIMYNIIAAREESKFAVFAFAVCYTSQARHILHIATSSERYQNDKH